MRVQQRVERPAARVRERGGDQVAGGAVTLVALLANSGCGEGFKFAECDACRFFHVPTPAGRRPSSLPAPKLISVRTSEVIKDAALIGFFLPQRQAFIVIWILVFTQRMKLITGDSIV